MLFEQPDPSTAEQDRAIRWRRTRPPWNWAGHEAAAGQPRSPFRWRSRDRPGPSGPRRRRSVQGVSVDVRARLCARRRLSPVISMLSPAPALDGMDGALDGSVTAPNVAHRDAGSGSHPPPSVTPRLATPPDGRRWMRPPLRPAVELRHRRICALSAVHGGPDVPGSHVRREIPTSLHARPCVNRCASIGLLTAARRCGPAFAPDR